MWNAISTGSGRASHTTVDGRTFTVKDADWKMEDDKTTIKKLASGETKIPEGKKLMMLPKVWGTLQ